MLSLTFAVLCRSSFDGVSGTSCFVAVALVVFLACFADVGIAIYVVVDYDFDVVELMSLVCFALGRPRKWRSRMSRQS